eukprot:CAMPEP_0203794368 /NCGR_PEP_ID=MMETSP0100_2-20121128/6466_1 /ASSEMBLY_ACC=CAM_ASM_000210 /TAXON_ID=96639 /ORGANISM=" , Strain NY0313808BC1" /LENGTH=64 /DNA_ID=CAMNT_0050698419 /DNA_START=532 /DNA_END=726 /DNA_ORIENTATION=-
MTLLKGNIYRNFATLKNRRQSPPQDARNKRLTECDATLKNQRQPPPQDAKNKRLTERERDLEKV